MDLSQDEESITVKTLYQSYLYPLNINTSIL